MGEIVQRDELLRRVAADRAAGKTLAFANGCFDLLHVGHVRYLEAAANEADLLIVAINDDESVRRLKGAGRPILPAADRAELVAALDATFRIVEHVLDTWTLAMLDEEIRRVFGSEEWVHTRGSVIQRVFAHDVYHAGQIQLLKRLQAAPA